MSKLLLEDFNQLVIFHCMDCEDWVKFLAVDSDGRIIMSADPLVVHDESDITWGWFQTEDYIGDIDIRDDYAYSDVILTFPEGVDWKDTLIEINA